MAIELTPLAQIVDVRAQVRLDPPCYNAANLPSQNFEIVPYGAFYALDSLGSKFAVLNKKNCEQIHLLLDERELQLRAFVPHEEWARVVQSWKKEGTTTLVGFDLNIYGLRQHAPEVGRILSSASLYLQRPLYGMDDYVYYNPHYLHAEEVLGGYVSETPIAYAEERTNNKCVEKTALEDEQQRTDTVEIDSILNSLSHHSFLVKSIADRRIKTNLKE
jgi:SWI/SNF-related matrix-associated actin-dependent regulator of chromatin subfamily A3